MLSIIIPVRDESDSLEAIMDYYSKNLNSLDYEILVINDFSKDNTLEKARNLFKNKNFKVLNNKKKGLGGAINLGIKEAAGSNIAIMMADQSDDINDLIKYNSLINEGDYDAILGSRFLRGSNVINYPIQKLILNRIFNFIVSIIFLNKFNDYTNAFKIYKSSSLKKLKPIVSESFNVFLEIPLKIISRKMKYETTSISWMGREKGVSKFKIKELRSKYLFTLLYCFLEKILIR